MKKYTLTAHSYTAEVLPECGMNCTKILYPMLNMDILRTPENLNILKNDEFLWGMPVLFFPNRISNGKFEFEGREYILPINEPELNNYCHGDLHKLPFEVTEYDDEHITGIFKATEDKPYMTFPHSFEFCIEYRIEMDGVHQNVSVKNNSDKNMPFALAFHTTFNTSSDMQINVPACAEAERNMQTFLPTGKLLKDFELKRELSDGEYAPYGKTVSKLLELNGRTFSLCDIQKGTVITYTVDEKYKYCMMYSGDGKKYICLEPQTWLTDCPNLDIDRNRCGFDYISPNSVKTYKSVLRAGKINT